MDLSKLARVLLEQDADGYQRACKELPKVFCNTFLPRIVCYLKQFVVVVIPSTGFAE